LKDLLIGEGLDGIGLQETIKKNFSQKELFEIAGGNQFFWAWKSARGTLVGFSWG
jgi:hypothetical protein